MEEIVRVRYGRGGMMHRASIRSLGTLASRYLHVFTSSEAPQISVQEFL